MKTIKSILIAATLICATAVSAQEAQAPKHEFKVAIGDSVMIKRECQKYCTGETPSVWVWDKVHTVRQLGTKRFPDGVLLMNIYSWMCEDCLIPVNGQAEEKAEQAKKEQAGQKKAYEQAVKDGKKAEAAKAAEEVKKAEEAKAAEAAKAAAAATAAAAAEPVKAEEAKAAEPAKAVEPAKAEEAKNAEEAKAAEPAKAEEEKPLAADGVKHETAKGDSIHSKQDFRSGYDRFTIGVRGGVASQLHQAVSGVNAHWGIGGDALLDLQYAHYWTSDARKIDLGLIVGLSAGYAQGSFSGAVDSTFTKGDLRYSVEAQEIKETDHQIQLEIPVMFSLIHDCGFFFNVGPRFMLPVYTPFKQTINPATTTIAAYNGETGVTLVDNPVTGQYKGEQPKEGNDLQWKINIMLTAELGYEWILKSGNSLGLGVYADYSVYNSRKVLDAAKRASLLDIANPPSTGGTANVSVFAATDTYASRVGYFDAGIKLAYHFNWPKKKASREVKLF